MNKIIKFNLIMEKKELILVVSLLAALVIAVALGFLHFTANFGVGMVSQ